MKAVLPRRVGLDMHKSIVVCLSTLDQTVPQRNMEVWNHIEDLLGLSGVQRLAYQAYARAWILMILNGLRNCYNTACMT